MASNSNVTITIGADATDAIAEIERVAEAMTKIKSMEHRLKWLWPPFVAGVGGGFGLGLALGLLDWLGIIG